MSSRVVVSVALFTSGCFAYSTPPPLKPLPEVRKLSEAKILDMNVDLYKQPGLCPGKKGKLYATATVEWPGEPPVKRNIGRDVDSLAPTSFAVTGPHLSGDAEAHLHPSKDVVATADSGFVAKIVYTPEPRFSFDVVFPPEYSCWGGWNMNGAGGASGGSGGGGGGGDWGQPGEPGENGGRGGDGEHAGNVTAYVTFASTRYFPRLLAVVANGTFFLAPPDVPLWFTAVGGPGGAGGSGGPGGPGGPQPFEDREGYDEQSETTRNMRFATGQPGNGGPGGSGARGGNAGDGGTVKVVYDSRFPELKKLIMTDVSGGGPGAPGEGGEGGAGGGSDAEVGMAVGAPGAPGAPGPDDARSGRPGRATVTPGDVKKIFGAQKGIVFLSPRPGGKS